LAELYAARLLAEIPQTGERKLIVRVFSDRAAGFVKLLAQRLTRLSPAVIALLGTTEEQPSLVFAQSAGQPFHMGALMKEVLEQLGGRGGGSKDLAEGGPAKPEGIEAALNAAAKRLTTER
jgi:alanyl-tRNA synthetase